MACWAQQETVHADGKSERVFGDGRRTVTFPNGTLKEELPDGRSIVRFTNRDLKRTLPSGAQAPLTGAQWCTHGSHAGALRSCALRSAADASPGMCTASAAPVTLHAAGLRVMEPHGSGGQGTCR